MHLQGTTADKTNYDIHWIEISSANIINPFHDSALSFYTIFNESEVSYNVCI